MAAATLGESVINLRAKAQRTEEGRGEREVGKKNPACTKDLCNKYRDGLRMKIGNKKTRGILQNPHRSSI